MAVTSVDQKVNLLPPYPEMIVDAIEALCGGEGAKNGVTRLAISKFMENLHGDELPAAHASILALNIGRMTESGELVLVNDGYFIGGPDAPVPKRGRGRPPKPRMAGLLVGFEGSNGSVSEGNGSVVAKKRGRPPKPVDPLAPVKVPRPRGRPPKNGGEAGEAKRPRGRPPKVESQIAEVGFV